MVGNQAPQVALYSFGYLHDTQVFTWRPHFIVDVRKLFRDPHHDPQFRELTGHHHAVQARVLTQSGAQQFVAAQTAAVAAVLPADENDPAEIISIAIGCAGGRHRSVVLVEAVAADLAFRGVRVEVRHLHIERPVVSR